MPDNAIPHSLGRAWPDFSGMTDPLDVLAELSRYYGSDPAFVLAGGGNTSVKIADRLFVKASGAPLSEVTREGFVNMDRTRLDVLVRGDLGRERDTREARYKEALLAARVHPEKGQRPSIECLLHHLMPGKFVVHSHATIANALTCCASGEALAQEIFGDEICWIPFVDPGFVLGQELHRALVDHQKRTGRKEPIAVLMANHGIIVGADNPNELRRRTDAVLSRIASRLGADWRKGAFGESRRNAQPKALVNVIAPALRGLLAEGESLKVVTFDDRDAVLDFVGSAAGKSAAERGPLSPDQIVYCSSFPLWFDPADRTRGDELVSALRDAVAAHEKRRGYLPRVVLVQGVGLFAAGDDFRSADTARALYVDAIHVMAGAMRLGGVSYMSDDHRRFIEDWEVEAYRRQVARAGKAGRVTGKVALVTGAAQGFGLEIAQHFCADGGHVVLADLNLDGAVAAAGELAQTHGPGRAVGLAVDVTDPESVADCVHQVVRALGGFDVLISNAGVLKAASVKSQPVRDFDFVTAVNYKGYFVCVQQAAAILAVQHQARGDYRSDIIQINSKSGLRGSNKNGAYAGSKFGGIGLTQSFALELIEDGIKVNAVCPGNFFDGPLWSDPRTGLFVQYLNTGKVPGAKTVADVRRHYEEQVPMGRGCTTPDVMRAIYYLIEQQYETGQALPVTGGQVMLSS